MFRKIALGFALGVTLVGGVGAAEAASIMFQTTLNFSEAQTNLVERKMQVNRFDPSLGNLDTIELRVTGSTLSRSSASARFPGLAIATAHTSVTVDMFGYNSYAANEKEGRCVPTYEFNLFLFTITDSCTVTVEARASLPLQSYFVQPEDLNLFVGLVPLEATVTLLALRANVTIEVKYGYFPPTNPDPVAPVPLPAAGGLLLLATGGLAALRHRRRIA